MYLDFDDSRPDTPTLDSAMSRREAVVLSVAFHGLALLAILFVPEIPWVQRALERAREVALARQLAFEQAQRENQRFVFIQPRLDEPAPVPPLRGELSDQDRAARSVEPSPDPANPLPFSRGNTTERVDMTTEEERAEGRGPAPDASASAEAAAPAPAEPGAASGGSLTFENGRRTVPARPDGPQAGRAPPGGALGEALRNLQRYTQNQVFDNPQGGAGSFGPWIQFDSKGVEFGPWIRRFVAQIKRNWFIPYAAMSLHGHVVLTFYVHKDGRLTDLTIVKPSSVEAFNNSAFNALLASNPTQPLPPEYPADRALFTVTFFYNETPPSP
jgi:TonB family protein